MAARKQPINTEKGQLQTMADALAGPLMPPAHVRLREEDLPFWFSIVSARARNSWDTCDLELAASLARAKSDCVRLQMEIDREGDVVRNDRGTQIMNPKHSLLETLSRRAIAMSRMLHVHPEAKNGDSGGQGKKLKAQKDAEARMNDADDLIGRPSVQ